MALAAAGAAALAGAVGGSSARLIAFAAPLLGVLCSIGWQPPAPVIRVHARPAAQRCFEDEPARLALWATGTGPGRSAVALSVSAQPDLHLDVTDAADRASKSVTCTAGRWGRYAIRAQVAVTGCGGLLTGTAVVDAADVTVFPLTPPQPTPIPAIELPDRVGTHLTRHTGRGVEYADIRAYVPGDPLHAINWPVSARRGRLHVTERLTDRAADVVVLIDGYPQPRGPATAATERTVRGAAQVVQTALRLGDRAGIVALGGRRPRWLGPDIGQRQFYRVLEAVLDAGDGPQAGGFETVTGTLAPRAAVPPGALIIGFSTLLDAAFALALTDLRNRGHVVATVDVLPDPPFEDEPDPLVAQLWRLQRSAMYRDMATIGIDVAPWPADRLLEQSMRPLVEVRRRASGTRR